MLVVCSDIKKSYAHKIVINHINLSLEQGRIYALLGQNGSGKSTLMKMIAGLVKIEQGNIIIQEQPIGVKTKGAIAYMPTEAYFYDYMKIEDVWANSSERVYASAVAGIF